MIIHSKFRDYYDIGLSYGIDTDLHWNREQYEVIGESIPAKLRKISANTPYSNSHEIEGYTVLLAGELSEVYTFKDRRSGSIVTKNGREEAKEYYLSECDVRQCYYSHCGVFKKESGSFGKREALCDVLTEDVIGSLHRAYNSPVLAIGDSPSPGPYDKFHSKLVVNPCLKDIGFQSIVGPYTCFQKISMYLSGALGCTESNMVEVSDETQKYKKGFDDNSFKHRGGKKPRRK